MLGTGEWTAWITERGGGAKLLEIPWSSIDTTHVLDASGDARVSMPVGKHEVYTLTEPWEHELLIYRGDYVDFVGPVTTVDTQGGLVQANDLTFWMTRRFIDSDESWSGDTADVFRKVFTYGYEKDPTPNITLRTRSTGVEVTRNFDGRQFTQVANVLGELARTGLDYTMRERTLLAGDIDSLLPAGNLLLHDEGVNSAGLTKEGTLLATDVAVFGAVPPRGAHPVYGRATRAVARFGLVQSSFAELSIKDQLSAYSNALSRLEAMLPAPRIVKGNLSPQCDWEYQEMLPGRLVDTRLSEDVEGLGGNSVEGTMRMVSWNVSVQANEQSITETIVPELIPVGVSNSGE